MNLQINKLQNARVYLNGTDFIGRAEEIDLPKIKTKTSDAKGLGMMGELVLPGGLDKMESRIKFNSVYADAIKVIANPRKAATVICRASLEVWDQTGVSAEQPVKAELRGFFKDSDSGKLKGRESAEAEATLDVFYYKLTINEEELVEIDVMNNIWKVAGEDILANYKTNIGG